MAEHIYLVFVDTPGFFAAIIRRVIRQDYIHVAISMDRRLDETYSVGRRNPAVPIIAGFEREEKEKILKAFPTARYMVCELTCTAEQKEEIRRKLHECMEHRYAYHYAVIGLPFIWLQIPFYQRNHFTCSSYVAKLLEDSGISVCAKHFSMVTPRDFMEYPDKTKIFEGKLEELCTGKEKWHEAVYGA